MSDVASPCDHETIARYLADELDPSATAVLLAHLDDCPECQERMQAAAGSDDEWLAAGQALRTDHLDESLADWESDVTATADAERAAAWSRSILGPTDDPEMLGRIGSFEVRSCVGIGGMGIVFKARDPSLDRYVAVKVLAPHLASSSTARERFAREARATAAVVHGNVVEIHHVSEWQGLPFLVMPYLTGASLQQRLERSGPLEVDEALRVALQVAEGLAAAHAQGLVHRDVKPANILLCGETERAILTDFGLARAADDATLTRAGVLAGTPQYMSPEQARGEVVGPASDLFGLGSVLFAMLVGRPPVFGADGTETIRRIAASSPPRLRERRPELPEWLDHLVSRLHAFTPHERIGKADEVARLISDALTHVREPAVNPVPTELVARRRPRGLLVVLAVLLVIGLAAAFLADDSSEGEWLLATADRVDDAARPTGDFDEEPDIDQRIGAVQDALRTLRRYGDDEAVPIEARERSRELADDAEDVLQTFQELRQAVAEDDVERIDELESEIEEVEEPLHLRVEEFELEYELWEAESDDDEERVREIEVRLAETREELRRFDDEEFEDDGEE